MTSILDTIVPKSDQMNADDLLGGRTVTIKITKVSMLGGDQPVAMHYEGDQGKPYKPSKGMRRVIVHIWGPDVNLYVGRSMTLYCDPKVTWGGAAVGGIRISHMSDIKEPVTLALTVSKANKKPHVVKPLVSAPSISHTLATAGNEAAMKGVAAYTAWGKGLTTAELKSIASDRAKWLKIAQDHDAAQTTNEEEIAI